MNSHTKSATAMTESLGERLKQARLNQNLTQVELAGLAGITRKSVLNAEKGKVQLSVFVAIMDALGLISQLDQFLPPQAVSPLQLSKLQGTKRQRASRQSKVQTEDTPKW